MKIHHTVEQNAEEKEASARGRASRVKGNRGEKWLGDHGQDKLDHAELEKSFAIIQKRQNKGDKFLPEFGIVPRWDFFDHIIHGESKWCERLSLYTAYEQARRAAKAGAMSTVFHHRNNKPVLCIMEWDDWWEIFVVYLKWRLAQHRGEDA